MRDAGIFVKEYPLPYGVQAPRNRLFLLPWIASTGAYRLATIAAGHTADCNWVCRQFLPTHINISYLAKKPIVLDVDDAIWLTRGGDRVSKLARAAQVVVCGNPYLAEKFSTWNSNVILMPTAIADRFIVSGNASGSNRDGVVLGWTGTSDNFPYLLSLEDPLKRIFETYPDVKLLIVADRLPAFSKLDPERVEFVKWTLEAEQRALQRMSIGLMPLEDSDWARGKCSYKMLRYMATSLPVVVSPVGMNKEILAQGRIGFGPANHAQWFEALTTLIKDQSLRETMGKNGVEVIKSCYSGSVLGKRYIEVFQSL